jgi:hypothetical protein
MLIVTERKKRDKSYTETMEGYFKVQQRPRCRGTLNASRHKEPYAFNGGLENNELRSWPYAKPTFGDELDYNPQYSRTWCHLSYGLE